MPDPDVIDLAAGLAPGDPLHAARRFRAKVVEATQASHDALLMQAVESPAAPMPSVARSPAPPAPTTTTRLPVSTSRTGDNFSFTPKCRICWDGSMKVRPI